MRWDGMGNWRCLAGQCCVSSHEQQQGDGIAQGHESMTASWYQWGGNPRTQTGPSLEQLFKASPWLGRLEEVRSRTGSMASPSLWTRGLSGCYFCAPAAPEALPFPCTGIRWRLVNYSNLQIAVVELASLERVKIFSLIEHLLPLIPSLFKGSFCCCCCYVPGFRYRRVLAVPEMTQFHSAHHPIP